MTKYAWLEKKKRKRYTKINKVREIKSRNLSNVRCIKSEDGRILAQDENALRKMREYFYKLLKEANL